jgi:hypothetical protein
MGALFLFLLAATSIYLTLKGAFQLLGLALGGQGFEGIIAFWIGAALLWGVGTVLGAW